MPERNVAASAARSQWRRHRFPPMIGGLTIDPRFVSERSHMPSLRTLLAAPPIVVAPGCYDALSALMIARAGFPAAYFSGASLAYTRFGRPDIGLIAMDEVVDAVGAIRERVTLPLIV